MGIAVGELVVAPSAPTARPMRGSSSRFTLAKVGMGGGTVFVRVVTVVLLREGVSGWV